MLIRAIEVQSLRDLPQPFGLVQLVLVPGNPKLPVLCSAARPCRQLVGGGVGRVREVVPFIDFLQR